MNKNKNTILISILSYLISYTSHSFLIHTPASNPKKSQHNSCTPAGTTEKTITAIPLEKTAHLQPPQTVEREQQDQNTQQRSPSLRTVPNLHSYQEEPQATPFLSYQGIE